MAEEPESGLTPEREPGESEDAQTDWEAMLKWVAENPDPRIPPQEVQNILFAQVAKLILRWAEAPSLDTAIAKYMRKRGSNDRAIVVNILERFRRRWGNSTEESGQFLSDCRLLARITWSHDPSKLREAVTEIEAAQRGLEEAKRSSGSRYAVEAIERALSELISYREPMAQHLAEIGYKRATKNWAAYEIARLACDVFERWIGGDIHARRNPGAPGDAEPGAGFPSFVSDLFGKLEVDAHWERPVKAAVKIFQKADARLQRGKGKKISP